jgi:hypothetical protein
MKALDPDVSGSLSFTGDDDGQITVAGRLTTRDVDAETLVRTVLKDLGVTSEPVVLLKADELRIVSSVDGAADAHPRHHTQRPHGWIDVIFQGNLPTRAITPTRSYKYANPELRRKIANCLAEFGAIAPLVLDADLRVIDGELRLELARAMHVAELPVIVYDASGDKADFLRLALNRSSEFQAWRHSEVGDFVDSIPNLQPLLEPLGFFGTRLLPVTYFSRNLIDYAIDEDNEAQQKYRQELGLEEWATMQRRRIMDAEYEREQRPLLPSHKAPKLFDLPSPDDEDFLHTYDPAEEIDAFLSETKQSAFEMDRRNTAQGDDA